MKRKERRKRRRSISETNSCIKKREAVEGTMEKTCL